MTHAVINALAVLGVVGQVLVVVLLLLLLVARKRVRRWLWGYELWASFVVAAIATGGSLFLSEVAGFVPCEMCWYQRICMYPLVPILAIAAARRDRAVRWYALPLAIIGAAISTWHILVERFPSLESGACDPANPCTIIWVEKLGYLTIPTMALSGFVVIGLLLVLPQEMP
jgi:disulfide bond formation protein DsbB